MSSYVTPWNGSLDTGMYEISMPQQYIAGTRTYQFSKWENNSLNPLRQINLNQNMNIVATYLEVINVANVTFNGIVSAQDAPGKTVTLKVTKPDGSVDTWTTTTLADRSFTPLVKQYVTAGQYSVIPSILADSQYKAAIGPSEPFPIGLQDRTITVTVVVG